LCKRIDAGQAKSRGDVSTSHGFLVCVTAMHKVSRMRFGENKKAAWLAATAGWRLHEGV
jgi:hypothetical protein